MPFTLAERAKIRTHLGYGNVSLTGSLQFGLPRPIQTIFLVETAMTQIIAEAEERVRSILNVMDGVECRLIEAQDRLAAEALGNLKTRLDEPERLEKEYVRWGFRLADELMVPIYPYSTRYAKYLYGGGGGGAGNIRVG